MTNSPVTGQSGQVPPVGPHPDVATLFVGALLWSETDPSSDVLGWVGALDFEDRALAMVYGAVRTLVMSGKPVGPQLVADELRRNGRFCHSVPDRLRSAVTSGAAPDARAYGAAVVAEALRRQVESIGAMLVEAAATAPERELVHMATVGAAAIATIADRLELLRGAAP